jgi:Leucine-rich repeat (LRR) protein
MLINYFKYCLSRSSLYYDFNENLLFKGAEEFDMSKLNIPDPSALQFANLSNLKLKSLPFISTFTNLETLIVSYNNLDNLV